MFMLTYCTWDLNTWCVRIYIYREKDSIRPIFVPHIQKWAKHKAPYKCVYIRYGHFIVVAFVSSGKLLKYIIFFFNFPFTKKKPEQSNDVHDSVGFWIFFFTYNLPEIATESQLSRTHDDDHYDTQIHKHIFLLSMV